MTITEYLGFGVMIMCAIAIPAVIVDGLRTRRKVLQMFREQQSREGGGK